RPNRAKRISHVHRGRVRHHPAAGGDHGVFRDHRHAAGRARQPQHQKPRQRHCPPRGARRSTRAPGMSAMKLWTFIKSPSGNLAVFAGFLLIGGFLVFRSHARDQARAEQMARVAETAPDVGRQSILRDGSPLKVPPPFTPAPRQETPVNHESRPRAARERAAERKAPAALPISLFTSSVSADATELSKTYAPYGRMIPCETVVTIESSRLDTPVIGLVTEDVWHDGRLIIPAGAEVHGRASLDRSRERI